LEVFIFGIGGSGVLLYKVNQERLAEFLISEEDGRQALIYFSGLG